jgi:hypothetical protein
MAQKPLEGTIAIIPCTNQKSSTPGKARDVWVGNHFQLTLAHAEMFYERVLVMSYKYGLIDPDFQIEPYDIDIRHAKAAERLRWWLALREQIGELCEQEPPPLLVGLYTGNVERDRIIREFYKNGVRQILVPWEGHKIGERMAAVYDAIPPFDRDKALAHAYDLSDSVLTINADTKWAPPPTQMTDEIEWED